VSEISILESPCTIRRIVWLETGLNTWVILLYIGHIDPHCVCFCVTDIASKWSRSQVGTFLQITNYQITGRVRINMRMHTWGFQFIIRFRMSAKFSIFEFSILFENPNLRAKSSSETGKCSKFTFEVVLLYRSHFPTEWLHNIDESLWIEPQKDFVIRDVNFGL
jgi:hypothetical protein